MGSSPAPFADIGKKAKGNSTLLWCWFLWLLWFPFIEYLYFKTCRSPKQGLHFWPQVYSHNAECYRNGKCDI